MLKRRKSFMSFCKSYGTFINMTHVTATLVTIPPDKVSQNRKGVEDLISQHNGEIYASYTSMNGSANYKLVLSSDEQRSDFIKNINQTLSNNKAS